MRDEEYPEINVVLAYPFEGHTRRWDTLDRERWAETLPRYNERVCVAQEPFRAVYFVRDRYMVDQSAYCIAYCTRDTGGTAYTLRYAQKQNLVIENIAIGKERGLRWILISSRGI